MRRVYRIEHLTERYYNPAQSFNDGPYQKWHVGKLDDMKYEHNCSPHHPGIRYDVPGWLDLERSCICGFWSVQDLKNWFDGWLEPLDEAGYAISVFDARDVYDSDSGKQIAFDSTTATLVSRERIGESSLLGFGNDGSEGNHGEDSLLLVR